MLQVDGHPVEVLIPTGYAVEAALFMKEKCSCSSCCWCAVQDVAALLP